MIKEYAVDPEGLGRLGPSWQLMDSIGIEHGRIIARFPKTWVECIYDAVEKSCPEIEKATIVERLNLLKKFVVRCAVSRPFVGNSWLDNAITADLSNPFAAIITEQRVGENERLLHPFDAHSTDRKWKIKRGRIVKRTESAIAECVVPLTSISKHIRFVDPYCPTERLNVIHEILTRTAEAIPRDRTIEIHASKLKSKPIEEIKSEITKRLLSKLPIFREITVVLWDADEFSKKIHARYVLTNLGGMRFDYGLQRDDDEETEVELMSNDLYDDRWSDFDFNAKKFGKSIRAVALTPPD
ncbi:MAG TPA: hypothetical protein VM260_11825 [Pirellula sp.]|nr:hypothetical protein [Pirellula sp.]